MLFVPYKLGNHKSQFVVVGLKNVLKHGGKVGIGNQPYIYHLEHCQGNFHKDHICDVAVKISNLMNILWRRKHGGELDKVMNPFSARLLPLWQPKSEYICMLYVKLFTLHV
jgi:hypothetical protein